MSMKRKTVTFEPKTDVQRMLTRACRSRLGRIRGYRTFIINEALRLHLKKNGLARKKD